MEVTDLMLGDLITFKDCQNDENPVILKIWQLNRVREAFVTINEAFVSIGENTALDKINIDDDIVGIPITPEILEKNGF